LPCLHIGPWLARPARRRQAGGGGVDDPGPVRRL